jgi:aspartyl-tRNA(Asn)/glutamyl-tRNA(Gln) amidotransferase subunit A
MKQLFAARGLDALLSPTMPLTTVPLPAFFADRPDYPGESPALSNVQHSFSANLTGQPARTVPCGLASNGLPIGFQLLGRPFDEATLFRMAHAYEREHSWAAMRPQVGV